MPSLTSLKSSILLLVFVVVTTWSQQQPQAQSKKLYRLQKDQTLNLSISSPIKIKLGKAQNTSKSHMISPSVHQGIVENIGGWNVTVTVRVMGGEGEFYFVPCSGLQATQAPQSLNREQGNTMENGNYIRQFLRMKEGINILSQQKLRQYSSKQVAASSLLSGNQCIMAIPKNETEFTIKLGSPEYQVSPINMQSPTSITVLKENGRTRTKIYLLKVENQFIIKLVRRKGFPTIRIYECQHKESCYFNERVLPLEKEQKINRNVRFQEISMLVKAEQFRGTKCKDCLLYLEIEPEQENETVVEVSIQSRDFVMKLKENQILNQQISPKTSKKYGIQVKKQQIVRVVVQVYEGQVHVTIQQKQGDWQYSPTETTGIITVEIPGPTNQLSSRTINLEIKALKGKEATYSLVYSSGQYEIHIKDGYPTSHILDPKQNISFFYYNEQRKDTPMYLSFNLNSPAALSHVIMRIYYFKDENKKQKQEYIPAKSTQQQVQQAKSFIVQIPGNYPKLEIVFQSTWSSSIEIAVTINDQEIIFLPLNHSLPLQIDKNGRVHLLVDNNEQGFIELVIKKCDESYPDIAYSLTPQDFMKEVYDYQSLGESQRITKSSIRVKKGGGLYIRISGDGISSSFLQITAKYLDTTKKKSTLPGTIMKGNYGQINYQLITNSKAQIWFKQLQCSEQCQKNTRYQCYWSTSKSDMFRLMICPNIYMLKNTEDPTSNMTIKSSGSKINSRPERDGIVSFKQLLNESIIYLGVKAIHEESKTELIYQNIEIVTIAGQLGRMSTQFLFISIGISIVITTLLFFLIRRQARLGYTAVNTSQSQRKKKTRLDIVKG